MREICDGIAPSGCLLLIEKLVAQESLLNRLYIQHYYEFKEANGYSELEIARKREALENVLIPYRLEENELMLRRAGFRAVDGSARRWSPPATWSSAIATRWRRCCSSSSC